MSQTILHKEPLIKVNTGWLVCMMLAALSTSALAKDYKVEVIVFENLEVNKAYESYQYKEVDEMPIGATEWLIEPSMLNEYAKIIEESDNYQLLHHLSWGQESLPFSDSAAINVVENLLNGWIKIYANHLLYANLDLDYNGYRLNEKRRIKLDDVHFFDHPKFGVLLQVSRLEDEPQAENSSSVPSP